MNKFYIASDKTSNESVTETQIMSDITNNKGWYKVRKIFIIKK